MARFPVWLTYSLACMLCWGLWGFFAKIAAGHMGPAEEQIMFTAGMLPITAAALIKLKGRVETDKVGAACGVLNGLLAAVGMAAYYAAMALGQASTVSAVTALFPIPTILLAVILLGERINAYQSVGVVLAVAAIFLLAG